MSRKKREGRRKNIKKIKSIQSLTFQQYKGQHVWKNRSKFMNFILIQFEL